MVNEILQWAALSLILVFVLGLTRQLGKFLTPAEQARAEEWGPATGSRIPDSLLSDAERRTAHDLLRASSTNKIAVAIVSDSCDACEAWLPLIAELGPERATPIIAMVAPGARKEYVARIREAVDLVVEDDVGAQKLRVAGLTATPMMLLLDDRFIVRRKQLGGDPRSTLDHRATAVNDELAIAGPARNGGV